MELQRPRRTPVLPQWDLGVVLEALSKSPYEPLREASFKHLTLKMVFLLAMASAGRRSELHALKFDKNYIQFKPFRIFICGSHIVFAAWEPGLTDCPPFSVGFWNNSNCHMNYLDYL